MIYFLADDNIIISSLRTAFTYKFYIVFRIFWPSKLKKKKSEKNRRSRRLSDPKLIPTIAMHLSSFPKFNLSPRLFESSKIRNPNFVTTYVDEFLHLRNAGAGHFRKRNANIGPQNRRYTYTRWFTRLSDVRSRRRITLFVYPIYN